MDKATTERLAKAVEATETNQAFMATPKEMQALTKDELVESNQNIKEGDKIAFRATQKGVETFKANSGGDAPQTANAAPQATPQPAVELSDEASNFEIESDVPVPEGRRRTGPKMKYPFDRLEVGQSFFVPATGDKPNPAKSLASTVSTAQRRYAVKDGTRVNRNGETVDNFRPTRMFRLEAAEKDGQKGARIWRTA